MSENKQEFSLYLDDWADKTHALFERLMARGFEREEALAIAIVWLKKSLPDAQAPLAPDVAQMYERMSAAMLAITAQERLG